MSGRKKDAEIFKQRTRLLQDAFSQGMTLDALVGLMRSRSKESPRLSSLYFAGADRDHPYFLHTDRVAMGLSVLPEDEPKSRKTKRHPHQHEMIFVLDGALRLEILRNGKWKATALKAGQIKVIYPNKYHRIVSGGKRAVFLFVKSKPAKEPRELACPRISSKLLRKPRLSSKKRSKAT